MLRILARDSLPEVWQLMESKRRSDPNCRLVQMFVGQKSGV
jgi:hypothetical protein